MKLFEKLKKHLPSFDSEKKSFESLKQTFTRPNGDLAYSGHLLSLSAQKYPNQTVLIGRDRHMTYKELYQRSVAFSKLLLAKGIKPRDKVILFSGNSLEFYVAYFGIWQTGAIVIPLNTFLHEKELAYVLNDSQPVAIVSSSALQPKITELKANGLVEELPLMLTDHDLDMTTDVATLEASHQGFVPERLETDELALLLYTSGTTGSPKGVMLSSRNIMTNALQAFARLNMTLNHNERSFCVLPLFHVFAQNACMWLPIMTGGSVIVVSSVDRKLILEGLKHKPTIFYGVPALYGLLCLMKNAPLDSVKMFVSGADAMPDRIRAGFSLVYGRKVCVGYGLTEASPIVAVNNLNNQHATNVTGKPVAYLDCDIRDDEGNSLEIGKIGTLWVKGDNVMMGYYKSHDNTQKVLQDGWLNTGDLGSFDHEGNLAICGRSKDLIIHKGFNIYPQEIENTLMKHPAVFKVAVVGQEDESSGQIPVAFVAVKGDAGKLEKKLRGFCSNNLAKYKIPKKFVCVEDLPMNATGKVDKKKLQLPQG